MRVGSAWRALKLWPVLALVVTIGAISGGSGASAYAAEATAYTPQTVCQFLTSYCLDLKGGHPVSGGALIMWQVQGAGHAVDFSARKVGKVSKSAQWPFTPRSGNNKNIMGIPYMRWSTSRTRTGVWASLRPTRLMSC
jgi:hypothetical protein